MTQSELADAVGCHKSVINLAIKHPKKLTKNTQVNITQKLTAIVKEKGFDSN
ncbi:MAG: hypothetical protein ABIC91_01080 [Nanoarchaeota archaeon]|nr:hypothetical protein [Nanoarchaeota archaeon]MBU1030911.1 hypothetical protein [Nanoarchaeota archaeon]MBU1850696.1 hypothetical protein [Nanoarchaeota archaeon]